MDCETEKATFAGFTGWHSERNACLVPKLAPLSLREYVGIFDYLP